MKLYNYEQGEKETRSPSLTKSFYYLLTIKRNSNDFTPLLWIERQRDRVKRMARDVEWSEHTAYEVDSQMRLHLHCIISSPKELYFTKFKSKGWTIHFQQFPKEDYFNVVEYLKKARNAYDGDKLQMEVFSWASLTKSEDLFIE